VKVHLDKNQILQPEPALSFIAEKTYNYVKQRRDRILQAWRDYPVLPIDTTYRCIMRATKKCNNMYLEMEHEAFFEK
jgi:hypothetical protein